MKKKLAVALAEVKRIATLADMQFEGGIDSVKSAASLREKRMPCAPNTSG